MWRWILCCLLINSYGQIKQVHSLEAVIPLVQEVIIHQEIPLVVFDLDETLLESSLRAFKKPFKFWRNLFTPTQDNAPTIVRWLQEHQVPTIGLTARSALLNGWTGYQLKKTGFDFMNNKAISTLLSPGYLPKTGAYYKHGVLYTKGGKSKVLAEFIRRSGVNFPRILVVDDVYENCLYIERGIQREYPKTEIICLYYQRLS